MRRILSFVSIVMLIGLSQCRKPVLTVPNNDTYQDVTFTVGDGGDKGHFDQNENHNLIYSWSETDKIYVYAVANKDDASRNGFAGVLNDIKIHTDGTKATFHGWVNIPAGTTKLRFVHYGSKINVNSDGSAVCDLSKQTGLISSDDKTVPTISSMIVASIVLDYSESGVYGNESDGCRLETQFAIVKFDLNQFDGEVNMSGMVNNGIRVTDKGVIEPIAGTFSTLSGTDKTDYYAALVEKTDETTIKFSDANKQGVLTLKDGVAKDKFYNAGEGASVTIQASVIDALPGVFSVGGGKTVHFSKGNLKCNTTTTPYWTYEFEENQWGFPSTYDDSYIGHFFWSENGNDVGDHGYGAGSGYIPFSTLSTSNVVDWGDKINNRVWRTLTMEEWWYLLSTRDQSLIRFKNFGNGNKGYVLLPDNALGNASAIFADINTVNDLAKYNAVFLPNAGYRDGEGIHFELNTACYWSKTAYTGSVSVEGHYEYEFAYGILFSDVPSSPLGIGGQWRYGGYSVRLVCE